MKTFWLLLVCGWAACLRGEAAPLALSPTALVPARGAEEQPAPLSPTAWSDHGIEYRFSLGQLSLPNGSPLSYSPIELGWRFSNGVRARTGIEIYFFNGIEPDPNNNNVPSQFSHSMEDWRSSLVYEAALPFKLRPEVGLCVDWIMGSMQLSNPVPGVANNATGAPGGVGPGALLGLNYRGGPSYEVGLEARYSLLLGSGGSLTGAELSWAYLF